MSGVKFLHSAMTGAPVLSGTAGAMIGLLDACLKDGFGLKSVDSLVIASGVATATISTGHSAFAGSVVTIAGATVTGGSVNGEHRATSVTTTTVVFDATGVPDQTATGTITLKMSPAGWNKPYAGTNLAAYKPSDVSALGMYLRVDDTGTSDARVVGYETMSDVNTGTGPFPTSAQQSGGYYWPKSRAADSSARAWIFVGDERAFVLAVAPDTTNSPGKYFTSFYGDFVPEGSTDAYSCALSGSNTTALSNQLSSIFSGSMANSFHTTNTLLCAAPRSHTGVGSSVLLRHTYSALLTGSLNPESGDTNNVTPYPNGPNGGLYVAPIRFSHSNDFHFRGLAAGLYAIPQNVGTGTFAALDSVTGVTGLTGRTLRAIPGSAGALLVDATGPWR